MKEKEYLIWKTIRAKGVSRFLLINGVISYGLPMFFVMNFLIDNTFKDGFSTSDIAINFTLWSLAGLSFGALMWFTSERRFIKETKKRISNIGCE